MFILTDSPVFVKGFQSSLVSFSFLRILKVMLRKMATKVASTMPWTVKAPKESLTPERPMIMMTLVIIRLEDFE